MERITAINPERIAWSCADNGTTPTEAASKLGIAESTIERVMAGEGGLSFAQLSKLATYLGRGVLFFLEQQPVQATQVHTAQFRTLTNQKPDVPPQVKKIIERVEKQRETYRSLLEDLEEPGQEQFMPPPINATDIKAAAATARQWLQLPARNTLESYRYAVEMRGILVFRSNGYKGAWQIPKDSPILGFTLYDPACPVIFVRKTPWEAQQVFSLMHELGHLLLHRSSSIDEWADMYSAQGHEREANSFAGYLLVPDAFLAAIDDATRPEEESQYDTWLYEHRRAWGVSGEVILRRLLDVGRLSQGQYTGYRRWRAALPETKMPGGSRAYRHREPVGMFGTTYVRTVLDALSARQITLAKASGYLDNLKIKDLHKLENYVAEL